MGSVWTTQNLKSCSDNYYWNLKTYHISNLCIHSHLQTIGNSSTLHQLFQQNFVAERQNIYNHTWHFHSHKFIPQNQQSSNYCYAGNFIFTGSFHGLMGQDLILDHDLLRLCETRGMNLYLRKHHVRSIAMYSPYTLALYSGSWD